MKGAKDDFWSFSCCRALEGALDGPNVLVRIPPRGLFFFFVKISAQKEGVSSHGQRVCVRFGASGGRKRETRTAKCLLLLARVPASISWECCVGGRQGSWRMYCKVPRCKGETVVSLGLGAAFRLTVQRGYLAVLGRGAGCARLV